MNTSANPVSEGRIPRLPLLAIVCAIALWLAFREGLAEMVDVWFSSEEYSHGILIPVIALFLVWQKRSDLRLLTPQPAWGGVAVLALALLLNVLGKLASIFVLQQYAFVLALYGLVAALLGWHALRLLWTPLLILLLMIPLPNFLLNNFSSQLQLISSQIGVWVVRLFGISVFVEGNVIDLGSYKLQVAEACDGLRYLFPLMTLAFLMAYFFKVALWKRVALFLSSIPLTIFMNSLRIGSIGVMVEYWGPAMAEGFLHEFQGWAVFMASAAVLLLEMMVLARIGRDRRSWRDAFSVEFGDAGGPVLPGNDRRIPVSFVASCALLVVSAAVMTLTPGRSEATPVRDEFVSFPGQVASWTGRRSAIEQIYLDTLKLDDYLMADYVRDRRDAVNFYVAWYDSQRAGQSAHSPRSCLPGGGWRMTQFDQIDVPGAQVGGKPLRANRVQIELGNQKQLVYYWFQQRGRVITNEYLVKWYLFWDSLTRRRTDGALVRLITPVSAGEQIESADARLVEFTAEVAPRLERFVPN